MHVGSTLKLLRVDAGLSLRALAKRVGVSSAYLSRVENGRDPAPTPQRLTAIAGALAVQPDMLVELAHQTGPALAEYIERVPAASAFFLEVARRDLDADQLARLRDFMEDELSQPDPEPATASVLTAIIGKRVIAGQPFASLDRAIDAGAARCARAIGADPDDVARQIRQREAESSTAIGNGVAVPHAIVPDVPVTATLVISTRPLPDLGPDGEPVEVAFVLVGGEAGSPHLETLARIARLASHGVAHELRTVTTPRRAIAAIERIESL